MYILGISAYYHDAAVCLIKNETIIYAAQEERFSRIKNDESFPALALQDALRQTNLTLEKIDVIIYYEKPFLKLERILKTFIHVAPKGWKSFLYAMQNWTTDKLFIKQNIFKELKDIDSTFNKNKSTLLFCNHHLSHAASAFFVSPFQEAAILTIDGVGEYATTSLAFGNANSISIQKEIYFPHSIGLLYSAITYFLGFKVNSDEYKVMGLAAYGNPESEETISFVNTIESTLVHIEDDGSYSLNQQHFSYTHSLTMVNDIDWQHLFGIPKRKSDDELTQSHCNLAFAFQKITEKMVLQLCKELKKISASDNLCLAGGVALNSVINGIIIDKNIFKQVFIQPASGDAGGAIGAALVAYYMHFQNKRTLQFPDAMQNSLIGNDFSEKEINEIRALYTNYYVCNDDDELCAKTAQYIADGKVIGWFQGKMEFGPRALGNRSILADARNEQMQLHLNLKIKNRESFRPFAPAVLEEDAHDFFNFVNSSPYMLQVHKVKEKHLTSLPENYMHYSLKEKLYYTKSSIPAVTHVDFTARIQTVNKLQHPLFWKLLNAFKHLTGIGLVINTSFNIKDEPIVCKPIHAYQCFIKTGMDILVIGNTIFYK